MQKSKHKTTQVLKKPLQLKATISETLKFNGTLSKIPNQIPIQQPVKVKKKDNVLERRKKLLSLCNEIQLNEKSKSSINSDESIINELQKQDLSQKYPFRNIFNDVKGKKKVQIAIDTKFNEQNTNFSLKNKAFSVQSKVVPISSIKSDHLEMFKQKLLRKSHCKELPSGDMKDFSNMKLNHISILVLKNELKYSKITNLNLSYNCLSNKSMPIILQLLNCNEIEDLSLKWNEFNYIGIVSLMEDIMQNKSLQSLDIGYNIMANAEDIFAETVCKLLQENTSLLHLNLEMCQIRIQHCKRILQTYNFKNETIIGLHFIGNCDYHVNNLGYIVRKGKQIQKDIKKASHIRMKNANFNEKHKENVKLKNTHKNSEVFSKLLMGSQFCWYCSKWACQEFKYFHQLEPSRLQSSQEDQEIFIHLECYDYQPIKLSKMTYVNNKSHNPQLKTVQWMSQQLYKVIIAIPSNKASKYFFTSKGSIMVNPKEEKIIVNEIISFEVLNICGNYLQDTSHSNQKFQVFIKEMNYRKQKDLSISKATFQQQNIQEKGMQHTYKNIYTNALSNIVNSVKKITGIPSINQLSDEKMKHSAAKGQYQFPAKHDTDIILTLSNKKFRQLSKKSKHINIHYNFQLFQAVPRNKGYFCYAELISKMKIIIEQSGANSEIVPLLQLVNGQIERNFKYFREKSLLNRHRSETQILSFPNQKNFIDYFRLYTRQLHPTIEIFRDLKQFCELQFLAPLKHDISKRQITIKTIKTFKKPIDFNMQDCKSIKALNLQNKHKMVRFKKTTSLLSDHIDSEQAIQAGNKLISCSEINENAEGEKFANTNSVISLKSKYRLLQIQSLAMISGKSLSQINTKNLTKNSIKSFQKIFSKVQLDHSFAKLNIEAEKPTTSLTDEIVKRYSQIINLYVSSPQKMLQILKEQGLSYEKIKQLNSIIITNNFYHICRNFEIKVKKKIIDQLIDISSLADLKRYLKSNGGQHSQKKSFFRKTSQESDQLTKNYSCIDSVVISNACKMINSQTLAETFQSLIDFMTNSNNSFKCIFLKEEQLQMKAVKKRVGKLGRSLLNIKGCLMSEDFKFKKTASKNKLLPFIENQKWIEAYNSLISELNILSQLFSTTIQSLFQKELVISFQNAQQRTYFQEVEKWAKDQISERLSKFIIILMKSKGNSKHMAQIINEKQQILELFFMNTLIELIKFTLIIKSFFCCIGHINFDSSVKNYEFTISKEIVKMKETYNSDLLDKNVISTVISNMLGLAALNWKQYRLRIVEEKEQERQRQAKAFSKITRKSTFPLKSLQSNF